MLLFFVYFFLFFFFCNILNIYKNVLHVQQALTWVQKEWEGCFLQCISRNCWPHNKEKQGGRSKTAVTLLLPPSSSFPGHLEDLCSAGTINVLCCFTFFHKDRGPKLVKQGFLHILSFFCVCVCVCFLIVTYPGFYFVFMGFICVLISIGCLSGGYFLLVSPRKFCFYTFCCLHFQTWPSFQRLYRSGKDWGSFLWFCLLCWTHGWKPPWEVLHCNTNMDKLNLLGFFLLQFPCPGVTMLTTTVIQILASPSQTLGFLFMSKYCSICAKWSRTAQNGTELEYLNPTTHFIFKSLQHKYVFPLVNHAISVALAAPEPAELCSNGGEKVQIAKVVSEDHF